MLAPVVSTFLGVLNKLGEERATAHFDPHNVDDVVIPIDRLTVGLDLSGA